MDLKLNFDEFYKLNVATYNHMSVAPVDCGNIATEIQKKLFTGDFSLYKPKEFLQRKIGGNKPCDLMAAGAPSFYLFSDKVINAFEQNGITGWGAYPVVVHTKKKGDLTNYYAFYITGTAEYPFDRSLCEKVKVDLPNGKTAIGDKGFYFPLESWDGSDIFYHKGAFAITVTERVKTLLESIKATNFRLVRCSDYIWPDYIY